METIKKNNKQRNPILGGQLLNKHELLCVRGRGPGDDHGGDDRIGHDKG